MVHLYNLTLQKSGGVNGAVYGNFSAPKAQEIAVIRNKIVELLRPDETGRVQTVTTVEAFGIVRSIASFRLAGANRDYLVVGSDSGRVVFLQFNKEKNAFVRCTRRRTGRRDVDASCRDSFCAPTQREGQFVWGRWKRIRLCTS